MPQGAREPEIGALRLMHHQKPLWVEGPEAYGY
jgi:hypothetical protein